MEAYIHVALGSVVHAGHAMAAVVHVRVVHVGVVHVGVVHLTVRRGFRQERGGERKEDGRRGSARGRGRCSVAHPSRARLRSPAAGPSVNLLKRAAGFQVSGGGARELSRVLRGSTSARR